MELVHGGLEEGLLVVVEDCHCLEEPILRELLPACLLEPHHLVYEYLVLEPVEVLQQLVLGPSRVVVERLQHRDLRVDR